MTGLFDNIHAGLDQQGAIDILSKEVGFLESESDYYMAISHLINFPGPKQAKLYWHFWISVLRMYL